MGLYKLLEADNKKYIYDAYDNKLIELPKRIFNIIKNEVDNDVYRKFLNENNLRDVFQDVEFSFKSPLDEDSHKWIIENRQKTLIISLTEKCNMRCEYCEYHSKYSPEYNPKELTESMLEKAIDEYLLHSKESKEIEITFYGGEPLLRFDLVQHAVKYVEANHVGQNIRFRIVTNGLLLDNKQIRSFLMEKNFYLTISLDGPERMHDRYRIDEKGEVTYHKVMDNLRKIKKENLNYYKERIDFNTAVVPPFQEALLNEYFKDCNVNKFELRVTDYFKDKFIENLNNEQENKNGDASSNQILGTADNLQKFKKFHTLMNSTSHEISRPCSYCCPFEEKIFVKADGELLVCEKVDEDIAEFEVGDIYNWIDYEKLQRLYEKTIAISQDNCSKCWAVRLCPNCYVKQGQVDYHGEYCSQIRRQTGSEFVEYLERMNRDENFIHSECNLSVKK